jgi:hypothetical protein
MQEPAGDAPVDVGGGIGVGMGVGKGVITPVSVCRSGAQLNVPVEAVSE